MYHLKFHPGETLVLNFNVPFSIKDVKAAKISFRGRDSLAFEATAIGFKSLDSVDEHGKTIYKTRIGYTMTQAESLQFEEKADYSLQLNVYGPNGSRITSKEMNVRTLSQQLPEPGYTVEHNIETKGSGKPSKGVTDYNELENKPQINEITLQGNRTLPEKPITVNEIDRILLQ